MSEEEISFDIVKIMNRDLLNRKYSYAGVHSWLREYYGRADKCQNKQCKNISHTFHWVKKKDKEYAFDRNNFIQLCCQCHYYYDDKHILNRTRKKKDE